MSGFEPGPFGVAHPLQVGRGGQRPAAQQRGADHFELVAAEAALGLEERGRAGQLTDRELRHRVRPGRAERSASSCCIVWKWSSSLERTTQRREHRAGREQEDGDQAEGEAQAHRYAPGTAASDSQR